MHFYVVIINYYCTVYGAQLFDQAYPPMVHNTTIVSNTNASYWALTLIQRAKHNVCGTYVPNPY